MKLNLDSKQKRSPEDLIPIGTHEARCIGIADLGTHETTYEGKPTGQFPFIRVMFEFPDFPIEYEKDGKKINGPKVLSQDFKVAGGEKANLVKLLNIWVGTYKDVDLRDLTGKPANVVVIHKPSKDGNIWANIAKDGISSMNEKYIKALAEQHSPDMYFSLEEHGFDSPQFEKQWKNTKKKIMESEEYQNMPDGSEQDNEVPITTPAIDAMDDEEIPF